MGEFDAAAGYSGFFCRPGKLIVDMKKDGKAV
jgi:hypothetical protein